MARRFTHVLGVDIGSDATKIVEVKLGRAGAELAGAPVVFRTPEHAVQGGVVVEPEAVGEAIKAHLSGFGTKKCICSIGGQASLVVRISEMPQMSAADLKEAIQWELERQTTFPPDQVIYDYCPIERPDTPEDAPNMEVLLAAAHEDLINAHVETLHAAGLQPVGVDIEPLAAVRGLVEIAGEQFADQTIAIVNIGENLSDITIIRYGLLSFVRSIPTAGEGLTRAISQAFVVDTDEAERIKRQHARLDAELGNEGYEQAAPMMAAGPDTGSLDLGTPAPTQTGTGSQDDTDAPVFELSSTDDLGSTDNTDASGERVTHLELDDADVPPPPPGGMGGELIPQTVGPVADGVDGAASRQVYDAIAPIIGELTMEIRRSLDFYRKQHRNESIDRVVLTGGSATIPGITDFVYADLGVPTQVGDPFAALSSTGDAPPEYLRDIGPMCAIATGLAIRDMVPE